MARRNAEEALDIRFPESHRPFTKSLHSESEDAASDDELISFEDEKESRTSIHLDEAKKFQAEKRSTLNSENKDQVKSSKTQKQYVPCYSNREQGSRRPKHRNVAEECSDNDQERIEIHAVEYGQPKCRSSDRYDRHAAAAGDAPLSEREIKYRRRVYEPMESDTSNPEVTQMKHQSDEEVEVENFKYLELDSKEFLASLKMKGHPMMEKINFEGKRVMVRSCIGRQRSHRRASKKSGNVAPPQKASQANHNPRFLSDFILVELPKEVYESFTDLKQDKVKVEVRNSGSRKAAKKLDFGGKPKASDDSVTYNEQLNSSQSSESVTSYEDNDIDKQQITSSESSESIISCKHHSIEMQYEAENSAQHHESPPPSDTRDYYVAKPRNVRKLPGPLQGAGDCQISFTEPSQKCASTVVAQERNLNAAARTKGIALGHNLRTETRTICTWSDEAWHDRNVKSEYTIPTVPTSRTSRPGHDAAVQRSRNLLRTPIKRLKNPVQTIIVKSKPDEQYSPRWQKLQACRDSESHRALQERSVLKVDIDSAKVVPIGKDVAAVKVGVNQKAATPSNRKAPIKRRVGPKIRYSEAETVRCDHQAYLQRIKNAKPSKTIANAFRR